jgi:hypothetical protein
MKDKQLSGAARRLQRSSGSIFLALSGALLLPAPVALAQSASSDIVVKALKPDVESRSDRKIYRVESEL